MSIEPSVRGMIITILVVVGIIVVGVLTFADRLLGLFRVQGDFGFG